MKKTLLMLPVLMVLVACAAQADTKPLQGPRIDGTTLDVPPLRCADLGKGHSRGGLTGDSDTAECNRLRTGFPDPSE